MSLQNTEKKENKLIKFNPKRIKWETNIGVILFTLIFIYLIGIVVTYFTEHSISTYEVTYGSIINDTAYNGLALRTENVYAAEGSGYVQFYYSEGSRVSYNTVLYTLSTNSIDTETNGYYTINNSEQSQILTKIQSYNKSYDSISFDDSYDLVQDIQYILNSSENDEKLNELSNIDSSSTSLSVYRTSNVGNLAYTIDGYETVTIENFDTSIFDKTNYSYSKVITGDYVSSDSALYKLITDEVWYVLFEVSDEDIETYEELSSVTVKFLYDEETVTAGLSLLEKDEKTYGILTLDTGALRYIGERYIDIELILEDLCGYKIPISSVVTKDFYEVPLDYVTSVNGENGILVQVDENDSVFQSINIYYQDTDSVYLLVEDVGENQIILQEETSDKLDLSETLVALDGVYNVNKGYAQYKVVWILTSSPEYYIVDDTKSYSITNYDHIALYGDSVNENAIVN